MHKTVCKYCKSGKEGVTSNCGVRNGFYTCTREAGHPGKHVACAREIHILRHWDNDDNAVTFNNGIPLKEIETLPY